MMIEENLRTFLVALNTPALSRVYGEIAAQNAGLPRIVYTKIASLESKTYCGTDGLVRGLFQIDSYDKTYKGAKQLALAVKGSKTVQALRDFKGLMGDTKIRDVSVDSEVDLDDPEPGLYVVQQTYFIWYNE